MGVGKGAKEKEREKKLVELIKNFMMTGVVAFCVPANAASSDGGSGGFCIELKFNYPSVVSFEVRIVREEKVDLQLHHQMNSFCPQVDES